MTTSDPLKGVTQLLRDAVADPGDVAVMPAGRDAAVARIADALRARARTQRRTRTLTTLSLAAGLALVVGGSAFAVHRSHRDGAAGTADARNLGRLVDPTGDVTAVRDGHAEAISGGARLAEGTELRTGAADASLDFESGTHVTLGGASRVRLVEQSARKRFALETGSFFAKVAKLKTDERFVVATPDAEVEVRGTAFRVSIVKGDPACEGGTPTRLDVSEGVVVITHNGAQVRVAAGEHWPACAAAATGQAARGIQGGVMASPAGTAAAGTPLTGPAAPAAENVSDDRLAAATTTSTAAAPAVAAGAPPTSTAGKTGTGRPDSTSRLAEQNDLFDEAMRLKRGGDAGGAMAKLDRLLAEYPGGPLSESASAERVRVLATSDRSRASAAAREYLRRYPRGFARAEAEAIAAGTP